MCALAIKQRIMLMIARIMAFGLAMMDGAIRGENRKKMNINGTNHHLRGCFLELTTYFTVCVIKMANKRMYRLNIIKA